MKEERGWVGEGGRGREAQELREIHFVGYDDRFSAQELRKKKFSSAIAQGTRTTSIAKHRNKNRIN
jgi:hypothetical protein